MINVDSDDDSDDDDMDMDMSENPTSKKMINYIGNEMPKTNVNRIKKLPDSIVHAPGTQRHSII